MRQIFKVDKRAKTFHPKYLLAVWLFAASILPLTTSSTALQASKVWPLGKNKTAPFKQILFYKINLKWSVCKFQH